LGIDRQLDSFRAVRRDIEASVLPLATSVDGRRFTFQASLYSLQLQVGSYAVLDAGGGVPRLGQVLALEMDQQPGAELTLPPGAGSAPEARTEVHIRYARGEGVIVDGDLAPFHDALIRVANETEVQAWQQRHAQPHAMLWLGDLALAAGVPCLADARGFSRHTFLCGQSGSGKTYSLGVILERLLIETDLRVVVLDPNSDFVRLGQLRSDADPVLAGRYRQRPPGSRSTPPMRTASGGCGCTRPRSRPSPRRQRCAWTRSPTATSTRPWPPFWPARTLPPSRH
jgi:Predicted ATPase